MCSLKAHKASTFVHCSVPFSLYVCIPIYMQIFIWLFIRLHDCIFCAIILNLESHARATHFEICCSSCCCLSFKSPLGVANAMILICVLFSKDIQGSTSWDSCDNNVHPDNTGTVPTFSKTKVTWQEKENRGFSQSFGDANEVSASNVCFLSGNPSPLRILLATCEGRGSPWAACTLAGLWKRQVWNLGAFASPGRKCIWSILGPRSAS